MFVLNYNTVSIGNHCQSAGQEYYMCFSEVQIKVVSFHGMNEYNTKCQDSNF